MGKKNFDELVENAHIPVVVLDNKWHEIFSYLEMPPDIKKEEDRLNGLLKKQGKVNTETKDIKKIKKKLMDEIVELSAKINEGGGSSKLEKQIDDKKRLIKECNEKLDTYQDDMLTLPAEIDASNKKLMRMTLDLCYVNIQKNTNELKTINAWIQEARIKLKKQVLRKQEREERNKEMYSYLHSLFGAEVLDAFDLEVAPGIETKQG